MSSVLLFCFSRRSGMRSSLANYSVAYEKTQSNRISDFQDFVCSLFPKAILFDFYSDLMQFATSFHQRESLF